MCYMLSKETASWNDARKACQKTPGAKGDLATIADQETLDFFKRDLKLFSATWIGGEKISGEQSWTDGTEWNYTNWASAEPDNDDGLYLPSDYLWYDYPKSVYHHYLCQYSV